MIEKESLKQIVISIFIGACVAFFSTLFEGLATYLKSHATELISGGVTSFHYISKRYRFI